jgi:hypothetical protein
MVELERLLPGPEKHARTRQDGLWLGLLSYAVAEVSALIK